LIELDESLRPSYPRRLDPLAEAGAIRVRLRSVAVEGLSNVLFSSCLLEELSSGSTFAYGLRKKVPSSFRGKLIEFRVN